MTKYKVRWNYDGRDWRGHRVRLHQGEEVEMDEALATWLEADSPGMLHDLTMERKQRQMEMPGEDRMIKQAAKR